MGQSSANCYCAFCKTPRRIYRKRNISFANILAAAVISGLLMMAFWQGWDPRSIIFFVVILAVSEFLIQLRWRTSLLCRACGFDPVLYVKEPQKAAAKVKMHLDKRKEDPKYLMTRPLNLPTISAEKAEAFENKDKKGRLVSRQV